MKPSRIALCAFAFGVGVEAAVLVAYRCRWELPFRLIAYTNPLGWLISPDIGHWIASLGLAWTVDAWTYWTDLIMVLTFGLQAMVLAVGAHLAYAVMNGLRRHAGAKARRNG